jgi:hypothetical protein
MSTRGVDTAALRKVANLATTLLQRALHGVQGAIWQREPARQVCPECQVDFAPALTGRSCPVCGWQAPSAGTTPAVLALPRRGVREAAGVGLAWFLALLAFALLAHALYA